jgi:transposase
MSQRRKYSQELKNEAINMVVVQGLVQEEVARMLAIPSGTLGNWMAKSKNAGPRGKPGEVSTADMAAENTRLRKELAQAQMERDILKKATAYFAKESTQGTRS